MRFLATLSLALIISGASHAACPTSFSGKASHYGQGDGFHGRKTASGTRFDKNGMTAAHRCLPFGTRLQVSHGGRSVVVTITDRGPAAWTGKIIDLSTGSARAIGISGVGRITAHAL